MGYAIGRRNISRGRPELRLGVPDLPEVDTVPEIRIPDFPDIEPDTDTPFAWEIGAEITVVVKDSPAEAAGLEIGDMILAVDGESLAASDLAEIISNYDPGDRVELTILHDGAEEIVEVKLGRNPDRGGETAWLGVGYRLTKTMIMPRMRRFRSQ